MSVKTALALINRVWGEIENDLDADFDAETQVALAWFSTYGFDARPSGDLINIATAKVTSVEALFRSGVFQNLNGKAGLIPRDKLRENWSPDTDRTPTVWECVQHTARVLRAEETGGAEAAAKLVAAMGSRAEAARALAYRLYQIAHDKGWASEALVYNELAQDWARSKIRRRSCKSQRLATCLARLRDEYRKGDAPARARRALSPAPRPRPLCRSTNESATRRAMADVRKPRRRRRPA